MFETGGKIRLSRGCGVSLIVGGELLCLRRTYTLDPAASSKIATHHRYSALLAWANICTPKNNARSLMSRRSHLKSPSPYPWPRCRYWSPHRTTSPPQRNATVVSITGKQRFRRPQRHRVSLNVTSRFPSVAACFHPPSILFVSECMPTANSFYRQQQPRSTLPPIPTHSPHPGPPDRRRRTATPPSRTRRRPLCRPKARRRCETGRRARTNACLPACLACHMIGVTLPRTPWC